LGSTRDWITGPEVRTAAAATADAMNDWPTLATALQVHTLALTALREGVANCRAALVAAVDGARQQHLLRVAQLARLHDDRGLAFACLAALEATPVAAVPAARLALERAELLHMLGFAEKAVVLAHQALVPTPTGRALARLDDADKLLQARLRCAVGGWLGRARSRSPAQLLDDYFTVATTLLEGLSCTHPRTRATLRGRPAAHGTPPPADCSVGWAQRCSHSTCDGGRNGAGGRAPPGGGVRR